MKQRPRGIPVLGLIGGIGSGKSFVARHWAASNPVAIVDGDAAGHEVLEDPTVQQQLRRHFGDDVFDAHGRIIRRALARRVFGPDNEHVQAREMLEVIVHPPIRELLAHRVEMARATPGLKAVFVDAAILVEAGWRSLCDALVFIESPPAERLERVKARGWTPADLQNREASQLPLDLKRKEADHVIANATPQSLPTLDAVLSDLFGPAAE